MSRAMMWFRKDLRSLDNPALWHAAQHDQLCAVYVRCEVQWDRHDVSRAQRIFIQNNVKALHDRLGDLQIPLVIIEAATFSQVPTQLLKLAADLEVDGLFFNEEYELNESRLSDSVEAQFCGAGLFISRFHDQCLLTPGTVHTKAGTFPQSFTAFDRNGKALLGSRMRQLYPQPVAPRANATALKSVDYAVSIDSFEQFSATHEYDTIRWPAGEDAAHASLSEFMTERVMNYPENRDFPGLDATSRVSAYLAAGVLSARQCWQAGEVLTDVESEGLLAWRRQLVWRDYFRHLLVERPDLCRHQPYKQEFAGLPWEDSPDLFDAWAQGRTGYPLVDAAMRQLNAEAWMHNRLRMVVAMFLCKHLQIDWRKGERYFSKHLIDMDLASNNGGWQWSASTGVDAAPYFRIFNPIRQSTRFDREGEFIRKYVPELADLDRDSIHQPSVEQALARGYPLPIVEHREAREKTLAMFEAFKHSR